MSVGFYGKLPSHGDFLQRGLRDDFLNQWDAWLQQGLERSRNDLGERWVDLFLTSPVWRFSLSRDVIGGCAWAGVLLPSVDRVSRCFPFTIVAELPPEAHPFELAVGANGWFDWVEALGRRILEEEILDPNELGAQLAGSEKLLDPARFGTRAQILDPRIDEGTGLQRLALTADVDMGRFFACLAGSLTPQLSERLALWWSAGSDIVAPTVLMTRELPSALAFRELLAGPADTSWDPMAETLAGPGHLSPPDPARASREIEPAESSSVASSEPEAPESVAMSNAMADTIGESASLLELVSPAGQSEYESAAVTDVGRMREENQDAYLDKPESRLWVVADGMGGHQAGSLASRLITERADSAELRGDISERVAAVKAALLAVNSDLRHRGKEQPGFDAGSTVVALCLDDNRGVVLWAGDSRLYHLRDGTLRQITLDHSLAAEPGHVTNETESHVITRAIGGTDELELEDRAFDVLAGDHFLLCTDGLYEDLTLEEISQRMSRATCKASAAELVALALERGGHDNATALCITVRTTVDRH